MLRRLLADGVGGSGRRCVGPFPCGRRRHSHVAPRRFDDKVLEVVGRTVGPHQLARRGRAVRVEADVESSRRGMSGGKVLMPALLVENVLCQTWWELAEPD